MALPMLETRWFSKAVRSPLATSPSPYAQVNKKNCVYLPHTAGRYARKRFRKVFEAPINSPARLWSIGCWHAQPWYGADVWPIGESTTRALG